MEKLTLDEAIEHCLEKANYTECGKEHKQLAEWLKELKEYKQSEEKGLLIKLPFKIGTTVYVVGTKCLADEENEDECYKTVDCDDCIYNKVYIVFEKEVNESLMYNLIVGDNVNFMLNKTVFLTKEEAEKELERLEKENNVETEKN